MISPSLKTGAYIATFPGYIGSDYVSVTIRYHMYLYPQRNFSFLSPGRIKIANSLLYGICDREYLNWAIDSGRDY